MIPMSVIPGYENTKPGIQVGTKLEGAVTVDPSGKWVFDEDGIRFLMDFINGDTYYKIQYPEHNLVRTRAQLRLLQEQERVAAEMDAIVASI